MQFDAIVVGSGITGGWAAKELTQAGLTQAFSRRHCRAGFAFLIRA